VDFCNFNTFCDSILYKKGQWKNDKLNGIGTIRYNIEQSSLQNDEMWHTEYFVNTEKTEK